MIFYALVWETDLITKAKLYDLLAVLATSVVVVASLLYAYVAYVFDTTTLLVSVALPLVFGSAILAFRKQRILLFSFLAIFWSLIDDAPVFFDSVFTWPEVTRFHPFLPRLFMNVVLHSLSLIFLYLAVRKSMKGTTIARSKAFKVATLAFVSFVLMYAQNIPLTIVQNIVENSWYQFDVAEKLSSIVFLYLAIREAELAIILRK